MTEKRTRSDGKKIRSDGEGRAKRDETFDEPLTNQTLFSRQTSWNTREKRGYSVL